MKNEVLINELELFLELVGNYEFAINQLKKIDDDIELLHISKSAKLEAFDKGYLPRYIEDKIGERPKDFSYYSPLRFVKPLKVQKSKIPKAIIKVPNIFLITIQKNSTNHRVLLLKK